MAAIKRGMSAANGPTQSRLVMAGMTPARLTRPKVGFRPITPQQAAGMRTEPPVSVPRAKSARPAATAAAEPLDEPPGMRPGYSGLLAVPFQLFRPVVPKASSCRLVLPVMRQPASSRDWTTSA
ncbi:hypothetical protein D9M71_676550 [compost metagenome]